MILLSVLLVFAATEIAAQLDEDSAFLTVVPDDLETHVQSRTVRLTCVAYGVPFPNVTWIRLPSTVLTANTTNTTAVNGTMEGGLVTSTLKLCDVQQTHNGMYRCETSNGVTSETPENSITAKNFSLVIIPIESPSLVLYSPDRVYGESNTTIRIVCSATGVPNPTINWTIPNPIGDVPTSKVIKVYSNTTTMNGTEIVTSVLELCSVNIRDRGIYHCTAANERGNESRSFDLTVTVSPVLDQPASNEPVEVLRGNNVILNCNGKSFPGATITWLRNGVALTDTSKYSFSGSVTSNGGIFSFMSMITIASLVKVDEANYSCRAQVEGSNMTSEIEYRVIVIIPVTPTIILRPPSNVTLGAAQTVRLTCSGTGVPTPNVTWFNSTDDQLTNYTDVRVFNNEEIINGTTIVTSVLQLCSIKIADAGVYRCQTGNDSTTVDVLVQVPVQVTNGELQRTKEMEEFKNITLECDVSGHPLPMVTWLRDNMTLSTNMKYLISDSTFEAMGSQTPGLMRVMSRLTIVNLDLDDSGNYTCHAENTNSSQEVLYLLTVTSPVSTARIIDSSSNSLTRTAKSDVTLQCTGAGVPIPTVKWSNSAGPISTDSYHTVTQTPEMNHATMSTLRFPMLRISQAGTYECTAGSSSVEFTVQVQVPAKVKSTGRQTVNGKINEFATLTCTADGHPLPTISWFKNRTELRNIRKYFPSNDASEGFRSDEQQYPGIMQVTSRLIIQDLQSADSGTYTCQAQSSGTPADSSDPYQLLVSEPPPPDPCDIKNCNHGNCEKKGDGTPDCVCTGGYTGDDCDNPPLTLVGIAPEIVTRPTSVRVRLFSRANLTCRAIGNPAPDIYWYKNDNAMPEWKNREQITFNQVTLGDRGFYHCLVSNSEGRETSSDVLLNIRDIVQYRVDVNLPSSSARRRRQANANSMLLQDLIAQINMLMVGVEFEGARFFSAVESINSNAIIMTFTSANVNTGRLKTFVDERLATAKLTVSITGNQTVTINTTTAFSRFDGCPSETTEIPANSSLSIFIDWPESNIGQNVTVDCPCGNLSLGSTSLVAHRFCGGSFLTGGVWDTVTSPARIIDSSPNSLTRTAKSDVTLQCTGAGVPTPRVEWSNSTGSISTDSYHTVTQTPEMHYTTMSTLRFPSLRISQAGTYECTAGSRSVEFTVKVQVAAQLQNTTGGEIVIGTFNNSATLTCIADGHPLPTISWFKGAIKLEDINKYFTSNNVSEGFRKEMYPGIMQVTSSLIIRDLQTADSGIYTCQAQSSGTPGTPLSTPYQLLVTDVTATSPGGSLTNSVIITLSVIASAAVAVLITLIFCICCKRYNTKMKSINSTEKSLELNIYNDKNTLPPLNIAPEFRSALVSNMLILKWQIRLLDILGQGEFGVVYKAHLLQSKNGNGNDSTIVAVKTLKVCFDDDAVEQLVKESLQMKNFQHRNVMGMLGVCLDAGPAPYLVLPYMKNGDLLSYLKSNREELVLSDEPEENKVQVQTKLLVICLQIANGMQYLADNNIVHRDLAARNCMIDESWIIKVADFGLTKSVYEKRYFRQDKDESVKLPIKWLAVESIDDCIFTEKTDVWSFGVTCWEIFSGGRVPYGGLRPMSIANFLRSGERMDPPENSACSSEVFATVMQQCWEGDPDKRPTFSQLQVTIDAMVTSVAGYMELSVFSADSEK